MHIRDLSAPVTASKADWLPGRNWLGFTPQGQKPDAVAKCQRTIVKQFGLGYVLERITLKFEEPNPDFASDPHVVTERMQHKELKDRLVAVHLLRHSPRPLKDIIGFSDYERLQNLWSRDARRNRWSVAFPIIESFEIVGKPHARKVFSKNLFEKIYKVQATGLRILDDEAREAIADLEIIPIRADNAWIAIEDEFEKAEMYPVSEKIQKDIERDFNGCFEGETSDRIVRLKKRAAWLANKFVLSRIKGESLICDACKFDPKKLFDGGELKARSCFDVHHKSPLCEGKRYTHLNDFELLCPTCHRLAHLRIKKLLINRPLVR